MLSAIQMIQELGAAMDDNKQTRDNQLAALHSLSDHAARLIQMGNQTHSANMAAHADHDMAANKLIRT